LYNTQFQAPVSGTIAANNATIDISENDGALSGIQVTGTWVGTITVEGSNDNSNFSSLPIINRTSHALTTTITSNGIYEADTNGFQYLRIKSTAWTSGTATIVTDGSKASSSHIHTILRASDGTAIGSVGDALKITGSITTSPGPTGQATMTNSQPVVVASDQSTIPVNDGISSGGVYGALTMTTAGTTYEAKVNASSLSGRSLLTILPTTSDIYFGFSNTVTTSTGTKIPKDQMLSIKINKQSTVAIWLVSASASVNVRITEAP